MSTTGTHKRRKTNSSTTQRPHVQPSVVSLRPTTSQTPWQPLWVLCGLVVVVCVAEGGRVHHTDRRHHGDLYLHRGKNIHSLAWVVETMESCSISSITGDIRKNFIFNSTFSQSRERHTYSQSKDDSSENDIYNISKDRLSYLSDKNNNETHANKDFFDLESCDINIPLQLVLIKQLRFFENTYLIAHPYFRIFSNEKRKQKNRDKRIRQILWSSNTYSSKKETTTVFETSEFHITSRSLEPLSQNTSVSPPNHRLNVPNSGSENFSKHSSFTESPENVKQNSPKYHSPTSQSHPIFYSAAIFRSIEACVGGYLEHHPCVRYARQEVLRPRQKRTKVDFQDPLYQEQWHLTNDEPGMYDLNVVGVWESGITGRGVTVCVIDDGLEWRHPDLRDNYNPAGSYDLNSDDSDPSPVKNGERNEHGTRCAGEIAAVTNSMCGVGVAYRANISGIRVLGGRMTDSMEAAAFIQGLDVNDVYSCSWGPDDDGRTVDGPHRLARRALEHGITHGRSGYGAVYVVASGNGGRNKDNCNFDGYANSVYTVTIGAVDYRGRMPYYAEECAAMLAVTPSSGSHGRGIVTTDWRELSKSGCTKQHSGTSAAAPLAAAVVALALEVHPCLSWRDVQYLIALTSRKIDTNNSDWKKNGAGLHHSHQHGFGLVDAAAMVSAAAVWESVPFSTSYSSQTMQVRRKIQVGKGETGTSEGGTIANEEKNKKDGGEDKSEVLGETGSKESKEEAGGKENGSPTEHKANGKKRKKGPLEILDAISPKRPAIKRSVGIENALVEEFSNDTKKTINEKWSERQERLKEGSAKLKTGSMTDQARAQNRSERKDEKVPNIAQIDDYWKEERESESKKDVSGQIQKRFNEKITPTAEVLKTEVESKISWNGPRQERFNKKRTLTAEVWKRMEEMENEKQLNGHRQERNNVNKHKKDDKEEWKGWALEVTHTVDNHTLRGYALATLEFVQIVVSITHERRGSLRIELQCPSGTKSTLATPRLADNSTFGLKDWALGTVRCWGEVAGGQYILRVGQEGHARTSGMFQSWRLVLHGSPMSHQQFQDRRSLIERAVRGEAVHVNRSTLCHQPELHFHPFTPLPQRWLKVLVITGVFLVVLAVISSMEYIFCHNEEKQKLYLKLRDVAAGRAYYNPRRNNGAQGRGGSQREGGHGAGGQGGEGESQEEEESLLVTVTTDVDGREAMSMVSVERPASPSPSCDADISSLDDDGTDDDAGTSDTVVPRDTTDATDAATDLTNDEFMSEADEDPATRGRGMGLRGH